MPDAEYTAQEIVSRGRALYDQKIRAQVEAQNVGQYLVLDIETGAYEIAADHLTAAERAQAKRPDAPLFGMRIGYPTIGRIGGRLRPGQS